jgi:S-adenosylmethionine synthetase
MTRTFKVLITGASGLLGRTVVEEFEKDPKWQVIGLAYSRYVTLTFSHICNFSQLLVCFFSFGSRAAPPLIKLDLTNSAEVKKFVEKEKPFAIIHAAAQRFPDKVDKDYLSAEKLNVEVSRVLAEVASKFDHFCHFVLS